MSYFIKKFKSKRSRQFSSIDKRMKEEYALEQKTIRLFLLGSGESGKSTVLKQIKKIHNDHDSSQCKLVTGYIRHASMLYMRTLCQQSVILKDRFNIPNTLVSKTNEALRQQYLSLPSTQELTPEIAEDIRHLWGDKGIQETLKHRNLFQIHDNVSFFLNKIEKIADPNFEPDFDDYIRIRTRTTGFQQTKITIPLAKMGQQRFEITDVGGQKSERRKWMRMVSDQAKAIIYVVGLGDYDLTLFEDSKTNRLQDAVDLFKQIAQQSDFFENKSIFLFFNKYDLFKKKIQKTPMTVAFDDFPVDTMDPCNEDDAVRFVAGKFLGVFERQNVNLSGPLHILRTTALDTSNIQKMFTNISLDLVKANMKSYGAM